MRRFFLGKRTSDEKLKYRSVWALYILITTIVAIPVGNAVSAVTHTDISALRAEVQAFAEQQIEPNFPHLTPGDTLIVTPGNLDSRLRLSLCPIPLLMKLHTSGAGNANLTVKTSCLGKKRWSIYVPVKVETYESVLTANRSIARGQVISASDLTPIRLNTATLGNGFVREAERLVGMEAKRLLRAGDVVKINQVKMPDLVSKGDTVVLKARTKVLTVVTEGTALANGHLGEQIKVRNDQSRRVVDGLVMGPGEVQVASW